MEPRPEYVGGEHVGDFVFATDSFQRALTYTLRTKNDPSRWSAVLHTAEPTPPIVITPKDSSYFGDSLGGIVYCMPKERFKKWHHSKAAPDEWISQEPITLDPAKEVHINNANQALQAGVQLFLVQGDREASKQLFEQIKQLRGLDQWLGFLKEKTAEGVLTHENKLRGLAPMNLDAGTIEPELAASNNSWTATPRNHPGRIAGQILE